MIRSFSSLSFSKSLPEKMTQTIAPQRILFGRIFSECTSGNARTKHFSFSEKEASRGPAVGPASSHLPWVSKDITEVEKQEATKEKQPVLSENEICLKNVKSINDIICEMKHANLYHEEIEKLQEVSDALAHKCEH